MKDWIIKEEGDSTTVDNIAKELNVDKVLANLLVQRGITNFDDAKEFFRPNLENLHNPYLMKNMDKAVERLEKAIADNEKILIYGDYDVDGTTSVALVYSYLKNYYDNLGFYIPDRYAEGYGISFKSIDFAKENDFSLVIALDCGIKAVDKIDYANTKNVDYIICDHHTPGNVIPNAVAVLDQKQDDCNYPYKELSGCGVGFKLLQAYSEKNNLPKEKLFSYLDLVVISIASDIVPITGENRVLAYFGLKELNKNPRLGLKSIIKIAGASDKNLTISDIVFKIGPRINAAGRINDANDSVKVLVAQTEETAEEFAKIIDNYNIERREIDLKITNQALAEIEENIELKDQKSTVLYNPNWHKGVVGIVASRLIEKHYKPTIVLTLSNGLITGSARSVQGFDLYAALDKCSDLFVNFGGHKYAAGISLKEENLEEFKQRFEKEVANTITEESLKQKIIVDSNLELSEITPKFYRILQQLCPFGPENMTPIFVSKNVINAGYTKRVGEDKSHLKLNISQNNYKVDGIAFGMGDFYDKIKTSKFEVCYNIEENHFRGNTSLQLMVRDIKVNLD